MLPIGSSTSGIQSSSGRAIRGSLGAQGAKGQLCRDREDE
jgi:hypothetical protein